MGIVGKFVRKTIKGSGPSGSNRRIKGTTNKHQSEIATTAIHKCRSAIDVLETQDISLQTQIRLSEEEARALLRIGDRAAAETALKKKELLQRESERIQRTKVSLLSQILLVETAETRATALDALATGLSAHKSMSAKMYNDVQLDKLQDAFLEQACFEAEVSNVMAQSFDAVTSFDDETNAGLEKALEDLQAEEVHNALENYSFNNCNSENILTEEELLESPLDIDHNNHITSALPYRGGQLMEKYSDTNSIHNGVNYIHSNNMVGGLTQDTSNTFLASNANYELTQL